MNWVKLWVVLAIFALASTAFAGSYEDGLAAFEKRDYATAVREFRKAAENGNAQAQNYLGDMYYRGQGVSKSYTESIKWHHKAAEQGNKEAQFWLGVDYITGKSISKNYIQAHLWFSLAVKQGLKVAEVYLDVLSKEMIPVQVAETEELVRKWLEQHRK